MSSFSGCAWDVGIQTLSYCVVNVVGNTYGFKSIGQIDLISDKKYKCGVLLKNKSMCGKIAKFSGKNLDESVSYFCGTHKKFHKVSYDENSLCSSVENITCSKCKTKAKFLVLNENFCTVHKRQRLAKYSKEFEIKNVKKVGCYDVSIEELGSRMFQKLEELPNLIDVEYVYIENQPSYMSPTMKTISVMLFSYYIFKKTLANSKILKVQFIAPSSKLNIDIVIDTNNAKLRSIVSRLKAKLEDGNNISDETILLAVLNKSGFETDNNTSKNNKEIILKDKLLYDLTKEISVIYARSQLVLYGNNHLTYFDGLSKQDDVADAISHALKQVRKELIKKK